MMAFADLQTIIPRILKHVSFKDYLEYNGYSLYTAKHKEGFLCYKKETNFYDDIVFIGKLNNQEVYFSLKYGDQGDIIDFVKNRIEIDTIGNTFEPSKDHLIETCKQLLIFLTEKGESKEMIDNRVSSSDLDHLTNSPFTIFNNCQDIYDFEFFDEFKILQQSVTHPIFENRIFNSKGLSIEDLQNNKKDLKDIVNVVFPIYSRDGKECGLFYENFLIIKEKENKRINFFARNSNKEGLWLTNKINIHTNSHTRLTIVDNPVDALAHFQYLKEDRRYASVFEITENTLIHIYSLLVKEYSMLHLALGVSMKNFVNELKIILYLLNKKYPMHLFENTLDHVIIKIKQPDKESKDFNKILGSFLTKIKRHNNAKIKDVIKTLGDSSKPHLVNDIINVVEDGSYLVVKVPKNFKTLYEFEKIMILSFPTDFSIYIEKPMYMSWTKQNEILYKSVKEKTMKLVDKYVNDQEIFVITNN